MVDTQVEGKVVVSNVPVVREYPYVFPEELPDVPPVRQVEFRIDLIPNATAIAKAMYCLTPLEMQALSSKR